jgi:hypothetical protein
MDSECDIVKKYKKYPEFKRDMDEIQQFYNSNLNMALYENLDSEEALKIFNKIDADSP